MTTIQQVHWEMEMDYVGHPYYVTGNAIMHALGQQLPGQVLDHLQAGHGHFVPGQFGSFPDDHSQSCARPSMGRTLHPVERYGDLFLFREPSQPWLLDSRPRDALNTHPIRTQAGHLALAHETIMGNQADAYREYETTTWYLTTYIHADDPTYLPLPAESLDGLQFGGKRNYGYGSTSLTETQCVDLSALDYSALDQADTHLITLVTPLVLDSTYPAADSWTVPSWWAETREQLREREEQIRLDEHPHRLQTVDHGQVVEYTGDRPVETATNGVRRIGSHSKYGFGEFRVIPIEDDSASNE